MKSLYKLYLSIPSKNSRELIGQFETEEEANIAMSKYRRVHFPEHKYYLNINKYDNVRHIDFGSYSEFFEIEEVSDEEEVTDIKTVVKTLSAQDFADFRSFLAWVRDNKGVNALKLADEVSYWDALVVGSFKIGPYLWLILMNEKNEVWVKSFGNSDCFEVLY